MKYKMILNHKINRNHLYELKKFVTSRNFDSLHELKENIKTFNKCRVIINEWPEDEALLDCSKQNSTKIREILNFGKYTVRSFNSSRFRGSGNDSHQYDLLNVSDAKFIDHNLSLLKFTSNINNKRSFKIIISKSTEDVIIITNDCQNLIIKNSVINFLHLPFYSFTFNNVLINEGLRFLLINESKIDEFIKKFEKNRFRKSILHKNL